MVKRSNLQANLWDFPEETSITDHQQELMERLDENENLQIRGPIGCGKTFTVRHYLKSKEIEFEYYSVAELLTREDEILSEGNYEGSEVVVIDNFDVAPETRAQLEKINEIIEMEFQRPTRSVWLVISDNWNCDWFDTVIGMYRSEQMNNKEINQIHISNVLENIRKLSPEGAQIPELINIDELETKESGYHTIIRGVCDQT
jgi:phosphate starvation-inducible protein PhoH